MLRQTYHTPFHYQKKKTLTGRRRPSAIVVFAIWAVGCDRESIRRLTGGPAPVESRSGGCGALVLLVFLNLVRSFLNNGVTRDDWVTSRCCSGYDSGGEVIGRGSGNCGVVWSERSTSRGTAEDAGDGGSNNVSTKTGGQSNHHRPHHSQIGVRVY